MARSRSNGTAPSVANPAPDVEVEDVTDAVYPSGVPKNPDGSVIMDPTDVDPDDLAKVGAVSPSSAANNRHRARIQHRKHTEGEKRVKWATDDAIEVFDGVRTVFGGQGITIFVKRVEPQQFAEDCPPISMAALPTAADFYQYVQETCHKLAPRARYRVIFRDTSGGMERGTGYLSMPDTLNSKPLPGREEPRPPQLYAAPYPAPYQPGFQPPPPQGYPAGYGYPPPGGAPPAPPQAPPIGAPPAASMPPAAASAVPQAPEHLRADPYVQILLQAMQRQEVVMTHVLGQNEEFKRRLDAASAPPPAPAVAATPPAPAIPPFPQVQLPPGYTLVLTANGYAAFPTGGQGVGTLPAAAVAPPAAPAAPAAAAPPQAVMYAPPAAAPKPPDPVESFASGVRQLGAMAKTFQEFQGIMESFGSGGGEEPMAAEVPPVPAPPPAPPQRVQPVQIGDQTVMMDTTLGKVEWGATLMGLIPKVMQEGKEVISRIENIQKTQRQQIEAAERLRQPVQQPPMQVQPVPAPLPTSTEPASAAPSVETMRDLVDLPTPQS